jgi:hypothetical protein
MILCVNEKQTSVSSSLYHQRRTLNLETIISLTYQIVFPIFLSVKNYYLLNFLGENRCIN